MEESSEENEGRAREGKSQEGDNDDTSLVELLLRQGREPTQEGGPARTEPAKGENEEEDEEIPDKELEELNKAHRAEMERREAENRAQNLKLAKKCRDQVNKTKSSGSRGGAAPMLTSSIKASQKLRVKQKATQNKQQQGGGQKKPHRYQPGTWSLMEIHQYQKSTEFLIRKLPFQRAVQEIAQVFNLNLRLTVDAIFALQETSKVFLVNFLEDGNLCTIHQGRITMVPKDLNLVMKLRECMGYPVTFAKQGTQKDHREGCKK